MLWGICDKWFVYKGSIDCKFFFLMVILKLVNIYYIVFCYCFLVLLFLYGVLYFCRMFYYV